MGQNGDRESKNSSFTTRALMRKTFTLDINTFSVAIVLKIMHVFLMERREAVFLVQSTFC